MRRALIPRESGIAREREQPQGAVDDRGVASDAGRHGEPLPPLIEPYYD